MAPPKREGSYIFLPIDAVVRPAVMRLPNDWDVFRKLLKCQMLEPINPRWPRGIGLLGDEEGRFKQDARLNPWLQGNGRTYDVVGPLLVCRVATTGGLAENEIEWALKNVVRDRPDEGGPPPAPPSWRVTDWE